MFADNSVVLSVNQDPLIAAKKLESDLAVVKQYFLNLNLVLNTKKTKIMNFSRYWRDNNSYLFPDIFIDNIKIEQVKSFKYLGVTIDLTMRFTTHKDICIRNANCKSYMLGRIREYVPSNTALMLYKSMVLPYLKFGIVFLLNGCEADIDKLQKTQNKGLRCILRRNRMYDSELLHRDARLETWKVRALTAAMKLMFKFKFSRDYVVESTGGDQINTRGNRGPIFKMEHPNSNRFLNSTSYLLRSEWNKLPYSIRSIDDYEHFKMVIKRNMRGNYTEGGETSIILTISQTNT